MAFENMQWQLENGSILSTIEIYMHLFKGNISPSLKCCKAGGTWQPLSDNFLLLGNYGVLKKIGSGTFGWVYQAFDINYLSDQNKIARLVAIKMPNQSNQAFDEEQETKMKIGQAFAQESLLTARLAMCPYVVKVLHYDITVPYIVLEYCDGGDFSARISKTYSSQNVICWGYEIVSALAAAHNLTPDCMIHRDLKPQNMLLHQGHIKISDFGTSKMKQENESLRSLQGGYTLLYAAPEALDGKAYPATDMWSFGVIMYRLISGRMPFQADSSKQLVMKIHTEDFSKLNFDKIPKEICEFVHLCLHKEPSYRPLASQGVAIFQKYLQGPISGVYSGENPACNQGNMQTANRGPQQHTNQTLARNMMQTAPKNFVGKNEQTQARDFKAAKKFKKTQIRPSRQKASKKEGHTAKMLVAAAIVFLVIAIIAFSSTGSSQKMQKMKDNYQFTLEWDKNQDIAKKAKIKKWKFFLSKFSKDIPGNKDNKMRKFAKKRIDFWQGKQKVKKASKEKSLQKFPIWKACWSGELFDFTKSSWAQLSHKKQIEYASMYQRWYAKNKNLKVSKKIFKRGASFTFQLIPPGKYWMGSPTTEVKRYDYEKLHKIIFNKAFWITKTEVTQQQWSKVMGNNPASFHHLGGEAPVEKVSWNDCQEFCNKTGFSLPTEAQWEYACRAGTTAAFNLGPDITTQQVNYDGNRSYLQTKGFNRGLTVLTGSLKYSNAWGCFDFHGNVLEWCYDWYEDNYYFVSPDTHPQGPPSSPLKIKVLRGGSWNSPADHCRSASRIKDYPHGRYVNIGFRVCSNF